MSEPIFSLTYSDRDIQERFARLLAQTGNLAPAFSEIGEYCLLSVDRRFELEVGVDGIRWQPLSPRTLAEKRAKGQILKILQRTGLMRSRVNYQATSESCIIGVNDEKAKKHQLGLGVPKREFLGINDDDKQEIIAILETYITD